MGGITLAITAPAGDQTPRLLAQYMGEMEDVTQYCKFVAMEEEEAMTALNRGEITAVLALPQNFIQGVMWGDNPDLRPECLRYPVRLSGGGVCRAGVV